MDTYAGSDVPYVTAFAITKSSTPRAYIMVGAKGGDAWGNSAELLSTSNYTSYVPTKTGSGASGTWGISVTGNAATATKWQTARSIKIGNTAKNLDGTANLTWTVSEIGAAPAAGSTSIATLAATIKLGSGDTATIYQNGGTYQQKIEILDNSSAGDAVFKFSQSTNTGSSFATLMEIRDDGNIVATKFTGIFSGNSSTATALQTARTINGTSFNGSANITTAIWGTTRTITIGNTGKSVNGSGNVAWTLAEIGAAAASHSHSYLPLSGGTISGNLAVTGTTTFSGRTTHNGGIQSTTGAFSSTLSVSGAATLSGATSVTNATASTSKSTGALKVSGGAGIAGQMSAGKVMIGDKVTLEYNTVNECLDFVFN